MKTKEIDGELIYGEGVQAVVEVGLIVYQEATFDEQGNLLTEPTYREDYHFDIHLDQDDFYLSLTMFSPKEFQSVVIEIF